MLLCFLLQLKINQILDQNYLKNTKEAPCIHDWGGDGCDVCTTFCMAQTLHFYGETLVRHPYLGWQGKINTSPSTLLIISSELLLCYTHVSSGIQYYQFYKGQQSTSIKARVRCHSQRPLHKPQPFQCLEKELGNSYQPQMKLTKATLSYKCARYVKDCMDGLLVDQRKLCVESLWNKSMRVLVHIAALAIFCTLVAGPSNTWDHSLLCWSRPRGEERLSVQFSWIRWWPAAVPAPPCLFMLFLFLIKVSGTYVASIYRR